MTVYFAVSEEADDLLVILGTKNELDDETITGEFLDGDVLEQVEQLADELGDNGESCEDYVLTVTRYNKVSDVRDVCIRHGFVEKDELLDCAWG